MNYVRRIPAYVANIPNYIARIPGYTQAANRHPNLTAAATGLAPAAGLGAVGLYHINSAEGLAALGLMLAYTAAGSAVLNVGTRIGRGAVVAATGGVQNADRAVRFANIYAAANLIGGAINICPYLGAAVSDGVGDAFRWGAARESADAIRLTGNLVCQPVTAITSAVSGYVLSRGARLAETQARRVYNAASPAVQGALANPAVRAGLGQLALAYVKKMLGI